MTEPPITIRLISDPFSQPCIAAYNLTIELWIEDLNKGEVGVKQLVFAL